MVGKTLVIQLITEMLKGHGVTVRVDNFEFQPYWLTTEAINDVIKGSVVITEETA